MLYQKTTHEPHLDPKHARVTAFILINTEIGSQSEVLKILKEISEVKEAHSVYGVYDIIAQVEAKAEQELKDIVNMKIRRLGKIRSTLTMIVA